MTTNYRSILIPAIILIVIAWIFLTFFIFSPIEIQSKTRAEVRESYERFEFKKWLLIGFIIILCLIAFWAYAHIGMTNFGKLIATLVAIYLSLYIWVSVSHDQVMSRMIDQIPETQEEQKRVKIDRARFMAWLNNKSVLSAEISAAKAP